MKKTYFAPVTEITFVDSFAMLAASTIEIGSNVADTGYNPDPTDENAGNNDTHEQNDLDFWSE